VNGCSVRYRAQGGDQDRGSRGAHFEMTKNNVSRDALRGRLFLNNENGRFLVPSHHRMTRV
jgi:hypothetical protein